MLKSMQTHFCGPIGTDLCAELVGRGVEHFRISGLERNIDECNAMLEEADEVGAESLIITDSLAILEKLSYENIEWQNEPDGDGRPKYDHGSFMEAYKICKSNGNVLHGPTISNLDVDSLLWLEAFIAHGIPKDVIITYHHYTPNQYFWQAHKGFRTRQDEMNELIRIADGRRIACSESGYNDEDEVRQASNVYAELKFGKDNGLLFWTYYQINDDVPNGQHFGARRMDFSWKPVIECFSNE